MSPLSVFVNCPFDERFGPSFEAMIFTIAASGYRVRCALEVVDGTDIRFEKLCRLIRESGRSIHDLSHVELDPNGLPRFNMPFELGLFIGAKRFGDSRQRAKTALIMVKEPYRLPAYLSDMAGNDPIPHQDKPEEVIRLVRRYLHARPDGTPLPGAAAILREFLVFKRELPAVGARVGLATREIDAFKEYRTYFELLTEFLRLA